jgi:Fe-S cluster assembly iron-binding protein IscA
MLQEKISILNTIAGNSILMSDPRLAIYVEKAAKVIENSELDFVKKIIEEKIAKEETGHNLSESVPPGQKILY